jgi:hypothetical protein
MVGRGVSVEMASKVYVKSLIVSDDVHDRVLFDANLGELIGLTIEDGGVLEVKCEHGILRADLTAEELDATLSRMRKNAESKSPAQVESARFTQRRQGEHY